MDTDKNRFAAEAMTHIESFRLAGYFPKNTAVPPGWPAPACVREICSVSNCVNSPPEEWIGHWLHNEWGFFNTPDDARLVAASGSGKFTIFAYRLLPIRFIHGQSEELALPGLPVALLPPDFTELGFDVVSRSVSAFFECSPLSCNHMANEVPVSEFCLVDDFAHAVALAERFSREEPEPGPYFVLQVLREPAPLLP